MAKPAVNKLQDEDWVQAAISLHGYADRSRLAAQNRWDEAWRLYNNQYDFSGKANWQARNYVPKISMVVEMAASLVRRAMMDANEWFRYDGTTVTSKRMAPYLEKLAYWYLDILRFVDNLVPPLKGGLVGSLVVLKTHLAPHSIAPEMVGKGPAITISYPDPYNIWLDPSGRNLFVMEEEEIDLALAYDLADLGVLDGDAIKEIDEDWTSSDKEVMEAQRKQQHPDMPKSEYRSQIKLTHFWGSMPKKRSEGAGKWMIRNGHFVVANDKYLVRKPMDNPYDHKQLPYVVGSPFRRPFSVYHKGLVEDVAGLARAMTELMNLVLDSTLFSGIKAFEVDLDQIEDPQQILSGIYPGKVFTARKGGANTEMVKDIRIENVAKEIVGSYQMLSTEFQNATAVTEFISGAQSSAPGRTATEVVTKQQQGMGIFGEMARNLEGTVLEPMLEQLAHLIVQYHDDFTSYKVIEILGEEMAMELMLSDMDVRRRVFQPERVRVRASGVSSLLNRTDEIQKINTMLQTLGQFSNTLPMMFGDMDPAYFFNNLFKRMVRAYGWNEADFLRRKTAEQIAAEAAAAAAASGGAGGGPAGATPPGSSVAAQPGQPAPPDPAAQVMAQLGQVIGAAAGGGIPPNGMVR